MVHGLGEFSTRTNQMNCRRKNTANSYSERNSSMKSLSVVSIALVALVGLTGGLYAAEIEHLTGTAARSGAFAYSYKVYDFRDQIPAPGPDPTYKNTHTPKNWRLAIPSGVTTVKGILMVGTPNCGDTRDWYKSTFYEEFTNMYGFAFIGCAVDPGKVEPGHQGAVLMLQHAIADWSNPSSPNYCGHPELINAPIVSTGVSTGGGFASRLATNYPEQDKIIAVVPCFTRLALDSLNHPSVNSNLFNIPVLTITPDPGAVYRNFELETWRSAPYNARWSGMTTQGYGDAFVGQERISMPFLERAVRLRYPDGGDPSKGPLKLKSLDPKSGWVADSTTFRSGLITIAPAASYTGDITKTSWLMDKDLAYIYRAFATYDYTPGKSSRPIENTPGYDMCDPNSPREIRITSPWMMSSYNAWECQVQDPGNVTIKVDASIFAKNFPGWTKLEFYDGATKLGEAAPPQTSASLTANIPDVGFHTFSVLGYDANGKAVRTSNAEMVIIRGKYQYPKGNGSSSTLPPPFVNNSGFESGSLATAWITDNGKNTIVKIGSDIKPGSVVPAASSSDTAPWARYTGSYVVFNGLYSARSSGNVSGFHQTIKGLSPKTTYYGQAWAKSGDGTTQAAVGVSNYGGSQVSSSTTSPGWTRLNFRFTTDASHTTADIWCRIPAGGGDAHFDDFTVTTQPMSVFVSDSTFESGTLTDYWPTASGTNTIIKDVYAAHTGQYFVKSSGTGSRFQRTIEDLLPNTTYHGEAWLNSSNATASVEVSNYGGSPVTVSSTNPGWTLLTFTFKTDASHTTADIWCGVTSGSGDGYFDDVRVY
jgi:hypothetical protein